MEHIDTNTWVAAQRVKRKAARLARWRDQETAKKHKSTSRSRRPTSIEMLKRFEEYKKQLINIMNKSESKEKPHYRTELGKAFAKLLRCDTNFFEITKKLKPEWLKRKQDVRVVLRRQQLIEMVKNNEERPDPHTKLGQSLSDYTKLNSPRYSLELVKTIEEHKLDWLTEKEKPSAAREARIAAREARIKEMIELSKQGWSSAKIAEKFGVTRQTVHTSFKKEGHIVLKKRFTCALFTCVVCKKEHPKKSKTCSKECLSLLRAINTKKGEGFRY
jgi:predicted DNA-binding protein YlxM (UPF0122 family)